MLDQLAQLPFWQAFLALLVVVLLRSNGTYWLGRGAIAGWQRRRRPAPAQTPDPVEHHPDDTNGTDDQDGVDTVDDKQERAAGLIRRLGPIAVTLSYLTVGIQTAVHLTAGMLRMPLRHYLPAAVLGSIAWACLYATIGIAVVQSWVAAEFRSGYGIAALVAVAVVGLTTWALTRRRARTRS